MAVRLVMMGTGQFALPTFRGLYDTPHEVLALFTQPDRTGRGHHDHTNPLKELATERNTPVFQPVDVNAAAALDELRRLNADLYVVAAYGQILSRDLLQIPRLGVINVHASVLPKFRGAAPVQHAILNGEFETGVTIFQIEPKLDAGPVLAVERLPIGPKETAGELEQRLSELSVPATIEVIDRLEAGTAEPIPQDASLATRAPRLTKSGGAVDWSCSAVAIERHVRAMQPWPTSFTYLLQRGRRPLRLILLDVEPLDDASSQAETGTVVRADEKALVVQAGLGSVSFQRLRPEGKRDMDVAEFLHGRNVSVGDRLVSTPETR